MGSLGSRILRRRESGIADLHQPEAQEGPSYVPASCKRKRSGISLGPVSENSRGSLEQEENLQYVITTNSGKKIKITSEYAYQTLFLNGKTSDIKICALGKVWCLHKIFLFQSGYFATMLRDSCEESDKDIIDLEIKDHNIDAESLNFVLGSLYRDEYELREPLQVPRVLATACLLQVEYLIQQCEETMKETINVKTACGYYAAAATYGLDSVKTECFDWLLHNLMTHPSVELYKELSIDLMNLLISSANLLVIQKEIDVYTTLKEWMFLHLNPAWKGSIKQLLVNANNWFSSHREHVNLAFLETKRGIPFQSVFKNLRFQHIICDLASTRVIEQDALIPSEWLSQVYKQQWFTLLRAQQCKEIGPRYTNEIELEEHSMRCGKMIVKDGKYSWKWSGFNFGFPLHVIFTSDYILFKQNTFTQSCDGSVCSQSLRNIAFRLTLVYFDSSGKISFMKTTGYKTLTFENDEEQLVMKLDSTALSFPLYIFCNFLFISLENSGN
ncbi:PREDICTED: putative germ cell-less protein-like 1-like [Miniopterus natalensis]|uniref:putative germ cell-less protein-like 1-like n=1 Tax=Miniopterus natalensis TaxID=291302 RepID=UPI0007A6D9F6|nr:PREDICTED: putative germ cell-less protein-like 1-like [Miniopterus natalensis]